jgi:hypothetical protein
MSNQYKDYIVVLRPNRRTPGKLTDIALVIKDMDINKDITAGDFKANWHNIPTRNGNMKEWKKRNYALSPIEITTTTDLAQQGISCSLSTVKGTSTQSGWGTTVDINGDTHRIVYCYEENVLKIIEYGFFDKTASMFKSEDADKELRLAS